MEDFHGLGSKVYSTVDQLPLDAENRLIEHQLLYLDLPHCEAEFAVEKYPYLYANCFISFHFLVDFTTVLAYLHFDQSERSMDC